MNGKSNFNYMEKITDDQLKKELYFDLYGRYAIIRDIININRENGEKFRVLDVGGRGNLLKKFLPDDDVFYLDPLIESEDENFIEGDGCSMPLENESYDWLTSADVFEHIPKEKRDKFLEENIRVAKNGVILAAPFWSKEVERAEINANENYKNFSGGIEHMWLKEHIENGLPRENDLENFLRSRNLKFEKLHNNRLFLWQTILGISFFWKNNFSEDLIKKIEEFNYFYNTEVFPNDSAEPSYRKIYIIKKRENLKSLEKNEKSIDSELFLDVIKKAIDLIVIADAKNREILYKKEQEISEIKNKNQNIKVPKTNLGNKMRFMLFSPKKFIKKYFKI